MPAPLPSVSAWAVPAAGRATSVASASAQPSPREGMPAVREAARRARDCLEGLTSLCSVEKVNEQQERNRRQRAACLAELERLDREFEELQRLREVGAMLQNVEQMARAPLERLTPGAGVSVSDPEVRTESQGEVRMEGVSSTRGGVENLSEEVIQSSERAEEQASNEGSGLPREGAELTELAEDEGGENPESERVLTVDGQGTSGGMMDTTEGGGSGGPEGGGGSGVPPGGGDGQAKSEPSKPEGAG